MSQSFYKIWLHVVFATKHRKPMIPVEHEKEIYGYMQKELRECNCRVRIINGMPDHVHMLFLQNPREAVADTIKQVKGSTSYWINQNKLCESKFAWQNGYGVFSVSDSNAQKIYYYIRNQKSHHQKISFLQEYDRFMEIVKEEAVQ